ncbi:MAG: 50S ribosomal protein L23 [Cytophagales bacterium]|nr:50S ribosomal protein L23 [Cytophagales bacterium]
MNILLKPMITEKATALTESGTYSFMVDKNANKIQIKNAVEKMYGVTVEKVRTVNHHGKKKTRQTKTINTVGRTPSYKKAYVMLTKGEMIDFYSTI